MISAVAVALLCCVSDCHAKATVVVATNTVVYQGLVNGVPNPNFLLDITYDVTLNNGLYNYNYLLTTTPSEAIYSFTIGGAPDPLNTATIRYFELRRRKRHWIRYQQQLSGLAVGF